MKKRHLLAVVIILALFLIPTPQSFAATSGDPLQISSTPSHPSRTIYVDDDLSDYPNADFTKIQDAVDAASLGDTIIVYSGTYHSNLSLGKELALKGIDYPVVDGNRSTVITVTVDNCSIRGFKLVNGGHHPSWPAAGVWIKSDSNVIESNIIESNRNGIKLSDANYNVIRRNKIYSNDNDGISLGDSLSKGSHSNEISGNDIFSNGQYGISLFRSSNNKISANNISQNGHKSDYGGMSIYLANSTKNLVYLNDFVDNFRDVYALDSTGNIWNCPEKRTYTHSGKVSISYLGNYWSDYTGSDADGNGIHDIPYSITTYTYTSSVTPNRRIQGDNDDYPLIEPFENYKEGVISAEPNLTDYKKRQQIMEMVNFHRSSIPTELVLAVMRQEGGVGAFYVNSWEKDDNYDNHGSWSQPKNGDGVMQVTSDSGHRHTYTHSQDGYDLCIKDGCDYLLENYDTYGSYVQAVLHYNSGPDSLYIYLGKSKGDPKYLLHVATQLSDFVPHLYGLQNQNLVNVLNQGQNIVDSYLNNKDIKTGQSGDYYKPWQCRLERDLHGLTFKTGDQVNVTAKDGWNMRSEPRLGDQYMKTPPSPLSKGSEGQILKHNDNGIFADGHYWWYVKFGEYTGWCAEDGLTSLSRKEPSGLVTIKIANVNCQELAALGAGINKALDQARERDKVRKLAAFRAQALALEAENVGGLFAGVGGFFRKILSRIGWIDIQPPENVIELSIEAESVLFGLSHTGTELATLFLGPLGGAVAAVLSELGKLAGKEIGTRGVLRNIGYVEVEKSGVGLMTVIYDKSAKVAWVTVDLDDLKQEWKEDYGWEDEHIYMYVPFDKEPPNLKKPVDLDKWFIYKREQLEAPSAPASPRLISPTKGTTVTSPVFLEWNKVPGAIEYDFNVRVDANIGEVGGYLWGATPQTKYSFDLSGIVAYPPDNRFYWGVRAKDTLGRYSDWSLGTFYYFPAPSHPWPMFGHDAQNTFCSPYEGPETPAVKWVKYCDELEEMQMFVIGEEGDIYISGQSDGSVVLAIADSHGRWKLFREVPKYDDYSWGSQLALGYSGVLYISSCGGESGGAIAAFTPEGKELWRTDIPGYFWSFVLTPDEVIYVNYMTWEEYTETVKEGGLIALNSDGTLRWSIPGPFSMFQPVVSKDGTVYTYTASGKICAYDKQGGKQWEYNAQLDWPDYYDKMMVWLSIGADGTIYILPWNYCTEQNENITHVSILALTPKGTQKWCIDFPPLYPNEGSFPAVAPDGSIYIVLCKSGNDEGALYKISSNGKFEEIISGDFYNSALAPLVDSAGTIYITNYLDLGHEIIAVSLDGSQKWTLDLRPFINSYFNSINLIEMGKDGAIYILTENDLLAIGPAGIGLEVRVPIDARMYVKSIDMQSVMEGSQVSIYTKVTIVDANGEPVPRAAVSLATKPVGWGSLYQFGLTRVDGTVTFIYPPENFEGRYGAWVATVTDVEKQGWEYDRAQNVETSETCEIHCS